MGQYYTLINLDKKQFINPHKFGDGMKLLEFGCSADGTMSALAILLADGNGRGGGDLDSDKKIVGSWAGDRIVISGDYADDGKFLDGFVLTKEQLQKLNEDGYDEIKNIYDINLHSYAHYFFEDISEKILEAMRDDPYLRDALRKGW